MIKTHLSRHEIVLGGRVFDKAKLFGASAHAGGWVKYRFYDSLRGCVADALGWPVRPLRGASAGVVRVVNGWVPSSRIVRFHRAGVYWWAAFYSGDGHNLPAASHCRTEKLKVMKLMRLCYGPRNGNCAGPGGRRGLAMAERRGLWSAVSRPTSTPAIRP